MRIEVPWGVSTVAVEADSHKVAGVLGANVRRAVDPDKVVRDAVAASGAQFERFLGSARSPLLVVVNDGTRPTPTADVLSQLWPGLEAWAGRSANELTFVVATGTHRAATSDEIDHILGAELAEGLSGRVFSHDAKDSDNLVLLGRTSRGTDVWANSRLAQAGSVLVINSVEPHYFAGYTGGRKSLFPGLAGYETVRANHSLSLERGAEHLVLAGNPVHEDLEESLALGVAGKRVYSIQLVLDSDHRIAFASTGPLHETFQAAVAEAYRQFVLELKRREQVVVAVAPHPMDCDFYQINKAIQSGALAVDDGGVLIVVSECPQGLGKNRTLYDMLASADSPEEALTRAGRGEYVLGGHQAVRVARVLERVEVWVVSSLPDEQVRSMFMTPVASVQIAVDRALEQQGEGARALFLTEASITVPRVVHEW